MKRAINQYSLPELPTRDFLKLAKETGFDGVEVIINEKGELTPTTSSAEIEKISREAGRIGIKICSVCTALLWKYPLTSSDPEIQSKGTSIVEKSLEMASILKADTVLAVPGLVTEEIFYLDAYNRSREILEKIGHKAANYGINLGLENGGMKFLASPIEFKEFIDSFNNQYVGAYVDTANAMIEGYPEQWIRILHRRIKKVHFKDFKASVRVWPEAYTQLLQGDVNWDKVMKELRRAGFDDFLVAEIPPYKLYPLKLLKDTLSSMDLIISGIDKNLK